MYNDKVICILSYVWTPRGCMRRGWSSLGVASTYDEAVKAMRDDIVRPKLSSPVLSAGDSQEWLPGDRRDSYLIVSWTFANGMRGMECSGWNDTLAHFHLDRLPEYERMVKMVQDELDCRADQTPNS